MEQSFGRRTHATRATWVAASALAMLCALSQRTLAQGTNPGVTGTVRYYSTDAVVPGVVVQLSGTGQTTTSTDTEGAYAFSAPGSGAWQIEPAKTGGLNGAVSALDASWVLQAVVGYASSTPIRRSPATSPATARSARSTPRASCSSWPACAPAFRSPRRAARTGRSCRSPLRRQSAHRRRRRRRRCARPGAIVFDALATPVDAQDFLAAVLSATAPATGSSAPRRRPRTRRRRRSRAPRATRTPPATATTSATATRTGTPTARRRTAPSDADAHAGRDRDAQPHGDGDAYRDLEPCTDWDAHAAGHLDADAHVHRYPHHHPTRTNTLRPTDIDTPTGTPTRTGSRTATPTARRPPVRRPPPPARTGSPGTSRAAADQCPVGRQPVARQVGADRLRLGRLLAAPGSWTRSNSGAPVLRTRRLQRPDHRRPAAGDQHPADRLPRPLLLRRLEPGSLRARDLQPVDALLLQPLDSTASLSGQRPVRPRRCSSPTEFDQESDGDLDAFPGGFLGVVEGSAPAIRAATRSSSTPTASPNGSPINLVDFDFTHQFYPRAAFDGAGFAILSVKDIQISGGGVMTKYLAADRRDFDARQGRARQGVPVGRIPRRRLERRPLRRHLDGELGPRSARRPGRSTSPASAAPSPPRR